MAVWNGLILVQFQCVTHEWALNPAVTLSEGDGKPAATVAYITPSGWHACIVQACTSCVCA